MNQKIMKIIITYSPTEPFVLKHIFHNDAPNVTWHAYRYTLCVCTMSECVAVCLQVDTDSVWEAET